MVLGKHGEGRAEERNKRERGRATSKKERGERKGTKEEIEQGGGEKRGGGEGGVGEGAPPRPTAQNALSAEGAIGWAKSRIAEARSHGE